ncbi:alpha/beta hydrolase [Nisaea acidiphila]|uniref:Alpha/beta hydrolase n=1 Tax=Nisaea acidiphila TaxID=1862145 RepID=A0A9J7AQZ1_9PROT|nr:alpha/beta hydrolase [Nisaea acidiphila]UUX48764.1 alpha/beta hydrolase [Nisaea acidiphila]
MKFDVTGREAFAATGGRPFDGGKPALLMLHGAGMDHTVWSLQSRYFAHHGYTVLAVDLPGHGRSAGPVPETIPAFAEWCLSALEAAGAGDVLVMGHSMGALIALEVAARLGTRAKALALLGSVPEMKVHPDLLGAARSGNHAALETMVGWGVGRRAQIGGHRAPGSWVSGASMRLLEAGDYATLAVDLAACDAYGGALETAAKVTCPALLLCGADDKMTPAKLAQPLGKALPDCTMAVLKGAGHMMMIEQPDETLDALAEFFGDKV